MLFCFFFLLNQVFRDVPNNQVAVAIYGMPPRVRRERELEFVVRAIFGSGMCAVACVRLPVCGYRVNRRGGRIGRFLGR